MRGYIGFARLHAGTQAGGAEGETGLSSIWAISFLNARTLASVSGRRMRINPTVSGGIGLRLLDSRGHVVWTSSAMESAGAFDLPDALPAGLYFLGTTGAHPSFQARLFLP
jgi:hypothetical protein